MARNQRDEFFVGEYYHMYNKVVTKEKLFRANHDYLNFLAKYNNYLASYFKIVAYCLMPNHFHFIILVSEPELSDVKNENTVASRKFLKHETSYNRFIENQLGRFFSSVSLRHNKIYRRSGPLFKQGVRRVRILMNWRLLYLVCYVHHNPVHHRYRRDFISWPYSSYNSYLDIENKMVDNDVFFQYIKSVDEFVKIHQQFKDDYRKNKS